MKSTLPNMVIVLFTITLLSAAAVATVYKLTAAPIATATLAKTTNALAQVLPEFDILHEPQKIEVGGREVTLHIAEKAGEKVGYAVETISKSGFNGDINLMVGFTSDKAINNIAVISQKETPGLGDKIDASKSDFSLQFNGKNPADFKLTVKKDNGDVDAITASTISSRAYCKAVQRAYDTIKEL